MQEREVKIIALAGAIIMQMILLVYILNVNIPTVLQNKQDNTVSKQGTIMSIKEANAFYSLQLEEQCFSTFIAFKDGEFDFKEGDSVQIIAKIDEYGGKEQIIAHRISRRE